MVRLMGQNVNLREAYFFFRHKSVLNCVKLTIGAVSNSRTHTHFSSQVSALTPPTFQMGTIFLLSIVVLFVIVTHDEATQEMGRSVRSEWMRSEGRRATSGVK